MRWWGEVCTLPRVDNGDVELQKQQCESKIYRKPTMDSLNTAEHLLNAFTAEVLNHFSKKGKTKILGEHGEQTGGYLFDRLPCSEHTQGLDD